MLFVYVLLGLLAGIVLFFLVNALLTLVFGKILGYKFSEFYFWCFGIKKENGKFALSVGNLQLAAHCAMIKPHAEIKDTILYSLLPCIFDFLLCGVFLLLCGLYPIIKFILAFYFVLCIFNIILTASLVRKCTSDSPSAIMWRKVNMYMNCINAGDRPSNIGIGIGDAEIPTQKITDPTALRYYLLLYYYYLDSHNYDQTEKIANLFEINMPSVHSRSYLPYIYELIFYYSYIKPDLSKAEEYYGYADMELVSDKDVNGRRVYAYYLYCNKKGKDKALKIAKDGLASADLFAQKGLAVMEKDLLNELINKIEEEML